MNMDKSKQCEDCDHVMTKDVVEKLLIQHLQFQIALIVRKSSFENKQKSFFNNILFKIRCFFKPSLKYTFTTLQEKYVFYTSRARYILEKDDVHKTFMEHVYKLCHAAPMNTKDVRDMNVAVYELTDIRYMELFLNASTDDPSVLYRQLLDN